MMLYYKKSVIFKFFLGIIKIRSRERPVGESVTLFVLHAAESLRVTSGKRPQMKSPKVKRADQPRCPDAWWTKSAGKETCNTIIQFTCVDKRTSSLT